MRSKLLFIASAGGLLLALVSAWIFGQQPSAQAPAFAPAANPYADGIYANGIIESVQAQGENVNIYPEVSGPVTRVSVAEGDHVHRGDVLLTIDDSVQRATAAQQQAQAEASLALLAELHAQPRPESLRVAEAQVANAEAALRSAQDALDKQQESFRLDPQSVSRDALDGAANAQRVAATNLEVVRRQYELMRAGAWSFDIRNQERQHEALQRSAEASAALLAKYTLRAPADGIVRAVQAAAGSYVSPQGAYDAYTQGMQPLIVMGASDEELQVRVYIDEILIHRLGSADRLRGEMFFRGTDRHLPLKFARLQPYVSPKIELSNERQERVDLRVLPLIFRFERPSDLNVYPGQLVDVYVSAH